MAPLKMMNKNTNGILANVSNITSGVSTRSKKNAIDLKNTLKQAVKAVGKRKASPLRELTVKRAAFGDITNAATKGTQILDKENKLNINLKKQNDKCVPTKVVRKKQQENKIPTAAATKGLRSRRSLTSEDQQRKDTVSNAPLQYLKSSIKENAINNLIEHISHDKNVPKPLTRISDEFNETSLYVSAVGDLSDDSKHSHCDKSEKEPSLSRDINLLAISDSIPTGVSNFDKDNWDDPFQVSHYAMDIFNYLKDRECQFIIADYLPKQKNLSSWMRALLVDWMVEVQESFELNHETLYLAVKLVDLYLCKELTKKDELQLLGSASLFIASKFDERIPPLLEDFLYICDGAYTLNQLLSMERNILKTIQFDLGIPLSYRFLRRYARCSRVSMPTLTLARFVLELCLMEYSMVSLSDSKMAAAALYLAIKMKNLGEWSPTLTYYTGYKLEEILPVVVMQNAYLHKKPKDGLSTVRNKYSHSVFFEVAKLPLIDNKELT